MDMDMEVDILGIVGVEGEEGIMTMEVERGGEEMGSSI